MSLHAPTRRRERILAFGPSGSGKSTMWLTVAEWLHKTHSPAQMYVMDTDRAWEAMQPLDGHLDTTVTVTDCPTWEEMRDTVRKWQHIDVSPEDWLVVDMMNKPWSKAQDAFFERAYGIEIDEFFVTAKGDMKLMGGDYGKNWQAIGKMYGTIADLVQSRWPGHVLCCTPAKEIWEDRSGTPVNSGDADLVIKHPAFGKIGFKPQGQGDLPHMFHTVLFTQQAPSGWVFTTAKERNQMGLVEGDEGFRSYKSGEPIKDFVKSYLMPIAGWRP